MNKRQILDFFTLLNLTSITYSIYFIITYIDLVNKNQIAKANINIYVWFLILNIFVIAKRIIK